MTAPLQNARTGQGIITTSPFHQRSWQGQPKFISVEGQLLRPWPPWSLGNCSRSQRSLLVEPSSYRPSSVPPPLKSRMMSERPARSTAFCGACGHMPLWKSPSVRSTRADGREDGMAPMETDSWDPAHRVGVLVVPSSRDYSCPLLRFWSPKGVLGSGILCPLMNGPMPPYARTRIIPLTWSVSYGGILTLRLVCLRASDSDSRS